MFSDILLISTVKEIHMKHFIETSIKYLFIFALLSTGINIIAGNFIGLNHFYSVDSLSIGIVMILASLMSLPILGNRILARLIVKKSDLLAIIQFWNAIFLILYWSFTYYISNAEWSM